MSTIKNCFAHVVSACAILVVLGAGGHWLVTAMSQGANTAEMPVLKLEPEWPKPLPNNWITGHAIGVWVDAKDHVWLNHRPGVVSDVNAINGLAECCRPAPPVIEFDPAGNMVQAWGPVHDLVGKPVGPQSWNQPVEWPDQEHGIAVDDKHNTVWVVGWTPPSQVLKFTRDGKFLLRIGQKQAESTTDPVRENMAGPTGAWPDPEANELYVADGYHNRRVVVFDMTTGKVKREWGAYGNKPAGPIGGIPVEEQKGPEPFPMYPTRMAPAAPDWKDIPSQRSQQFSTVHCVVVSRDKIVYVCDRVGNRVQAFKSDGTYLQEVVIKPRTRGWGSVHGMTVSTDPGQKWLYVADGANLTVWVVRRSDLAILGNLGQGGRKMGEFGIAHSLAVDSKNNVYLTETASHNRIQKFVYRGVQKVTLPSVSN